MTLREMADQQTLSGPKPAEVASSAARVVATRGQWWSPLAASTSPPAATKIPYDCGESLNCTESAHLDGWLDLLATGDTDRTNRGVKVYLQLIS